MFKDGDKCIKVSERIYLGHIKKSTDIIIIGNAKEIKIGLISIKRRHFINKYKERKTSIRFNIKNTNCQLEMKIILLNAINNTGSEVKKR